MNKINAIDKTKMYLADTILYGHHNRGGTDFSCEFSLLSALIYLIGDLKQRLNRHVVII